MSERDELGDDVREAAAEVRETRSASPTPHARRFRIFLGVLTVLALAAVGGAIAVATSGGGESRSDEASAWAVFRPTSDGLETGAKEIAAYVGPQYRMPTGQQIVNVEGGPMEVQSLPMRIAVRHSAADGGKIEQVDGRGVLYSLCGLGPKCAIASGKTSTARGLLLYREALELALYSFHDLKDVKNVVVFMPPALGKEPTIALHFRRGQVAGQLARPLRATLTLPVPTPDTIAKSPDTPFVKALTLGNAFQFSFSQSNQASSVYLVLDPPPADS